MHIYEKGVNKKIKKSKNRGCLFLYERNFLKNIVCLFACFFKCGFYINNDTANLYT